VFDDSRQRAVLFGGCDPYGQTYMLETWEWDGGNWDRRTPATSPPPRLHHAMAYAPTLQRVVLFGGADTNNNSLDDTWEWDGIGWTRRTPATRPTARRGHVMTFSWPNLRILLFGGGTPETWEWDGSNWIQRFPTTTPTSAGNYAAASDLVRFRVVLFGGVNGSLVLADTWEWDGSTWLLRQPAQRPPARAGHAMSYDSARQRVVLFGRQGPADTWEWDGTNWLPQTLAVNPPAIFGQAMTYDFARRRTLFFGGSPGGPADSQTWLHGNVNPATAQVLGTGCAGSNGTPMLTSNLPTLGNRALVLDLLGARAGSPCGFGLAPVAQVQPLGGGCTLYLQFPTLACAMTNAAGFATAQMAIPPDTALRGLRFYAQAAVLDPQGAAFGLAFTAARALTIDD
jgi:hypothetical protein